MKKELKETLEKIMHTQELILKHLQIKETAPKKNKAVIKFKKAIKKAVKKK